MNRTSSSMDGRCLGLCLLLAGASGCVSPMQRGLNSLRDGDPVYAIQLWTPLAQAGDRDAQYLVGLTYDEGKAGPANPEKAAVWYRMAAERGSAPAQNNLGVLYYEGRGVERSVQQASEYYRRAADQGFAPAQHNLGALY